jgi:hypothetical protein
MKKLLYTFFILGTIAALTPACTSDEDDPITTEDTSEDDDDSDSSTDDSDSDSSTDDSDSDSSTSDGDSDSSDSGSLSDDVTTFTFSLDESFLDESETIDEDDEDYVENSSFESEIAIAYSGTSATITGEVDGVTVTTDGADVTVNSSTAGVKYVLSGTASDGSFKIYSSKKYELDLDGVSITNSDGAAINSQSEKRAFIVIGEGTTNTLVDGSSYDTADDEDEKGTIFSEGQIIFSGNGTLDITGNYKHGIASDDYLRFRPGNVINITASAGNGLKANDAVTIDGGVLNITVTSTAGKGISSDGSVDIKGGRATIFTSGGGEYDEDESDATACAGVKADSTFTIEGGKLYVKSTGLGGKGISADQDMYFKGGEVGIITTGKIYQYTSSITSSPKGIKGDSNITIDDGTIMVRTTGGDGAEGIESEATLTVNGGTVKVYSYDDPTNAEEIVINDGNYFSYATNNDGMDANGPLTINGGIVIASGAASPESGFDSDNSTFAINGGVVIGTGGSTSSPSTSSKQPIIVYNGSLSAGKYLTITDSNSSNIFTYLIPRSSAVTLISSSSLSKGSSYTLGTATSVSGEETFAGYYSSATVSGNTSISSVTLSSMVTTIGTSTGQPGGNPGGGFGM